MVVPQFDKPPYWICLPMHSDAPVARSTCPVTGL